MDSKVNLKLSKVYRDLQDRMALKMLINKYGIIKGDPNRPIDVIVKDELDRLNK